MTDPVTTMAAGAIVNLAFQKFAEAGGTKLAEKFTETGLEKLGELWAAIRERLEGKWSKVDEALMKLEAGDSAAIEKVAGRLDGEMDDDEDFDALIRGLVREVTLNQVQGDKGQIQNNFGGTNFQNQIDGGEVVQGTNITINKNYGTQPQG